MDSVVALKKDGGAMLPDTLWLDYDHHTDTSALLAPWDFVAHMCAGVQRHIEAHNHEQPAAAEAAAAAAPVPPALMARAPLFNARKHEHKESMFRFGMAAGLTKKNAAAAIMASVSKTLTEDFGAGTKATYTCKHGVNTDGFLTMDLFVSAAA